VAKERLFIVIFLTSLVCKTVGALPNAGQKQPSDKAVMDMQYAVENRHQIFENLYQHEPLPESSPAILSLKQYREQIKSKLSLHFHDNLQIGVDTVKAKSLKAQKCEIIALEPHLAPKGGKSSEAKGYGLEVKLQLD
jgi:hypothetical protein